MDRAKRKWFWCLFCVVASLVFLGDSTLPAQDYPTKPINLIVPSAPGGQSELMIRTLSPLS